MCVMRFWWLRAVPDTVVPASIAAALGAAAAVTAGRQALLRVWPAFAAASQRSNRQVSEHGHLCCMRACLPSLRASMWVQVTAGAARSAGPFPLYCNRARFTT